ncbi:putative transcriptional regulator RABBIT EARS [Dendrobium catenatum]|uniref:Putative transcriptional regulator RABBIT EARS n=1 Tax=Dendrobium catenatum TaxID=906689 RepID=A0A2I0WPS1_9ASPA|nr:putative transcriptional regulator RABBIT EARS [Dendrobium catenatum]
MNEKLDFNKHQSISHPPQDIYHLMNQSSVSKSKFNVLGDLVNHDWEAVRYFLKCQVRCGGDVSRIYKCNFCGHEFPNAQAFGGHMSSHSKTKKSLPKKTNRARKGSFNFCSRNESRLRMARGMMKDSLKESLESEESINGEIVEENGEEWFQYLNSDAE